MIWMMTMMLAKFIAQPCRKISQGALINILILCMTIFDQEWVQSFVILSKATRYLLSDAMVALHWTSGVNRPPYRSISIDIFISLKHWGFKEAWRPVQMYVSARLSPTNLLERDGGEAHRDTLLSRTRTHTGTRAFGRERAARSLRSAAMTSRTFIHVSVCHIHVST